MVRRIPTFVVLVTLLAACATTAPPNSAISTSGSSANEQFRYLRGVNSEYSVRLDELRPNRSPHRRTALPHAVVAGDHTITVAASMFRCDGVLALDLIIQNHGPDPVEIDRSRIALFDDRGDALPCKYDWKEGYDYGLRSTQDSQRAPVTLQQTFLTSRTEPSTNQRVLPKPNDPLTSSRTTSKGGQPESSGYDWISEPLNEGETLTLPSVFVLEAGENTPYWAYWRAVNPRDNAEAIVLPITAMVTVGNKKMFFRFEEGRK